MYENGQEVYKRRRGAGKEESLGRRKGKSGWDEGIDLGFRRGRSKVWVAWDEYRGGTG